MNRCNTLLVKGSYLISSNETVCIIYVMYESTIYAPKHLLA